MLQASCLWFVFLFFHQKFFFPKGYRSPPNKNQQSGHMSKQLDNLVVYLLTHKVYNSLLFVKTFHIPPSSITMLISLGSFAGNREGPSQAFENPHRAICQSGVRGPAVSLGNRLQNAVSGPRLGRRWGGSWICILKLNEIIAEHAVCILFYAK